jgi:hypothetical protein
MSLRKRRYAIDTVVCQFGMDAQVGEVLKGSFKLRFTEPCLTVAPLSDQCCRDFNVKDGGHNADYIFLGKRPENGRGVASRCVRFSKKPRQRHAGVQYEALSQDARGR